MNNFSRMIAVASVALLRTAFCDAASEPGFSGQIVCDGASSARFIPDELAREVLRKSVQEPGRGRLCIRINSADPSDELIAALHLPEDLVIPASACKRVGMPEHRQVVETATGKPAQFLSLSNFVLPEPGRGSISIMYSAGDWQGYGRTVEVQIEDGVWRVGAETGWIVE